MGASHPERFAIKVIWLDGEEEFLKEGGSPNSGVAMFANRGRAESQRNFMLLGMEDEVQSINVVPYPSAMSYDLNSRNDTIAYRLATANREIRLIVESNIEPSAKPALLAPWEREKQAALADLRTLMEEIQRRASNG